jgi:starvation-inducible DNA-binding protein
MHAGEQLEVVDALAERVQTLGGVFVGDPRHTAELTSVPRAPDGVEEVPVMISRLLEAGTGELQAWFLAEHLVETPLVQG